MYVLLHCQLSSWPLLLGTRRPGGRRYSRPQGTATSHKLYFVHFSKARTRTALVWNRHTSSAQVDRTLRQNEEPGGTTSTPARKGKGTDVDGTLFGIDIQPQSCQKELPRTSHSSKLQHPTNALRGTWHSNYTNITSLDTDGTLFGIETAADENCTR